MTRVGPGLATPRWTAAGAWQQAGVDVTHRMGDGAQDRPAEDPRGNLP